jgi:hypothetical protein
VPGPLMGWPMQRPCKVKVLVLVLVLVLVPCRCKLFLSHEPWTPTVLGSDFSTPNTKGLCHLPHAGPSASFVVRRLLTPAHFSLLSLTSPTPSTHLIHLHALVYPFGKPPLPHSPPTDTA